VVRGGLPGAVKRRALDLRLQLVDDDDPSRPRVVTVLNSGGLAFSVPSDDAEGFSRALAAVIIPHVRRMRRLSDEFVPLQRIAFKHAEMASACPLDRRVRSPE
jgi:hypothetical protein